MTRRCMEPWGAGLHAHSDISTRADGTKTWGTPDGTAHTLKTCTLHVDTLHKPCGH